MSKRNTAIVVALIGFAGVVVVAIIQRWPPFGEMPSNLAYQGVVRDRVTNLPVKNASVVALARSGVTPKRTDDYGNFKLEVPLEKDEKSVLVKIQITHDQYKELDFDRELNGVKAKVDTDITMEPKIPMADGPPVDHHKEWPTKFENLSSAELQASEIDDYIFVKMNGQPTLNAGYGETPPWISIKDLLHKGQNAIEVIVQNGQYGGCGATVVVRLNGLTNADYKWKWEKTDNQPANVVCFQQVKTLSLD